MTQLRSAANLVISPTSKYYSRTYLSGKRRSYHPDTNEGYSIFLSKH